MKKRVVTETLLEECPNCGAARIGDETVCSFCQTSMVSRTSVTEEILDDSESRYDLSYLQEQRESLNGKFISSIRQSDWDDPGRTFLLVAAGVSILIAIICGFRLVYGTFDGLSGEIFMLCGLMILGPLSLILFTCAVIPVKISQWFTARATDYDATVLKVSKQMGQSYIVTMMTAKFMMDGTETMVKMRVPNTVTIDKYPEGSTVKLKLHGDRIMFCGKK